MTASGKQNRFCIDDAFEEETDEAIRVYGAVTPHSPSASPGRAEAGAAETGARMENGKAFKVDASRDSDSLIQDGYDTTSQEAAMAARSCFQHPKVRENWRMVLAAAALLVIGVGLLTVGVVTLTGPHSGLQGAVFLLAGFICFVPGAYHVVYIYLAAKGKRGYHFHNLPLFT